MALTIDEIRVKIIDAYQRATKAADEVVGNARAAVQLDDDLKRVIKIFRENREALTKNLSKLTHTELMALAYLAPELTQFILDYEQEALAKDYEIARKEFSGKPEDDLEKQNVKKDFADTLELLQKLSEKHVDDLVLTEKILDVSNSVPIGKGKSTTRTLFEFYYAGPMATDQSHERKATITEKANKDLTYLANRSDLAAVILKEPLYIPMVRNAAATDANLTDALVSHIRRNNTEKALKFATEVITTEALCKLMNPKIGEWLAYKFWFGSHPSEKIATKDLINRLLAYKEDDESALDKNLIEAFLAKKLLGREYWREINAEQWKIILKFLSDKVGLKEGDVYLRLVHERCSQALGDVDYQALKTDLPQIPIPNTPGLERLNVLGIFTPAPGRNRAASIAEMSSAAASVAPMSSGKKSLGLRRTQSVAEMPSYSHVDVAAVDLSLSPIAREAGEDFLFSTPVAAAGSNPKVGQSIRKNFEALVGEKKRELSFADMNMNASGAAESVPPMSSGPGSVAGMSSVNSVASLGSSVKTDVQPPRRKSSSPTRQQRLTAMLEEAAVAVSVAGMSPAASPLTSNVVTAKANSSVAAMPEVHKEGEQAATESSLVAMPPSPGSPRPR